MAQSAFPKPALPAGAAADPMRAPLAPLADVPDAHAGAVLTVDLGAVARNYRHLRTLTPGARVSAVVKADGYGLGAERVARRLAAEGCDLFFVGHLEEGLALRTVPALDGCEIAVLNGLLPGTEAVFGANGLTPVLNTPDEIARWRAAQPMGSTGAQAAMIHVDTGMSRLGLPPEAWAQTAARDIGFPVAYVLSHLACADEPDHPMNADQRSRYRECLAAMPDARASLANSGGIALGRDFHFDMVRPGLALYGADPGIDLYRGALTPAVCLRARILQVREIDTGDTVGYGATFKAAGRRRIATLSAGYADGYPRSASGSAWAGIGAHRVPLAGRVSMDLISADVTDVPADWAQEGGWVDLIGGAARLDDVARAAGTVSYEILTALGRRYARHYVES